jgi:hypothetical protein
MSKLAARYTCGYHGLTCDFAPKTVHKFVPAPPRFVPVEHKIYRDGVHVASNWYVYDNTERRTYTNSAFGTEERAQQRCDDNAKFWN